jgi:uncharacterized lipoprotein NlpE involved in copper resistance
MLVRPTILVAAAAIFCLTGCKKAEIVGEDGSAVARGRYVGIGVYSTGELWPQIAQTASPKDKSTATLDDDEHVIVVVDTKTGEIRECGDYSGRCVSMNPWTKVISPMESLPVPLTKHGSDLRREREEEQQRANARNSG